MLANPLHNGVCEAGVDEAGRGALAGSLFAAAVILPPDYHNAKLNDSKKLTAKVREQLREEIVKEAIAWGVGEVSAAEVDEINVLNGAFLAMERAIMALKVVPELLLIDGNRFRQKLTTTHYECIIKGDGKVASIAAASILAKTFRDDYITKCGLVYPQYGFASNKGYPTKKHKEAIFEHGISDIHRKTFCSFAQNTLF